MDTEFDKYKDYVATDNKQPSMAEFYGITTMPTLILVGKDGKVIKNDVDIETLKKLLAEEFK